MGSINFVKPLLSTARSSSAVNEPRQHQEKFLGTPVINPGAAGCEAKTRSIVPCAPLPRQLSSDLIILWAVAFLSITCSQQKSIDISDGCGHSCQKLDLPWETKQKYHWRNFQQLTMLEFYLDEISPVDLKHCEAPVGLFVSLIGAHVVKNHPDFGGGYFIQQAQIKPGSVSSIVKPNR